MTKDYNVRFLTPQSANQKVLYLLGKQAFSYEKKLELSNEDYGMFKDIVSPSKSKLILGAFTKNYGDQLVGLMSFRFTEMGVKRINTLAFERRKGIGTALVKRLCEFTSEVPQYSINAPEAVEWVRKLGMTPGETIADGRQYHHWTPEQVKEFSSK